jgi:hypothetical protein
MNSIGARAFPRSVVLDELAGILLAAAAPTMAFAQTAATTEQIDETITYVTGIEAHAVQEVKNK